MDWMRAGGGPSKWKCKRMAVDMGFKVVLNRVGLIWAELGCEHNS